MKILMCNIARPFQQIVTLSRGPRRSGDCIRVERRTCWGIPDACKEIVPNNTSVVI